LRCASITVAAREGTLDSLQEAQKGDSRGCARRGLLAPPLATGVRPDGYDPERGALVDPVLRLILGEDLP